MTTFESFQIIIFLIPGFLSSVLLDVLVVRKERDKFKIFIEGLIFSLIFYVTLSIFRLDNPIILNKELGMRFNAFPSVLLILISILFSVILAKLVNSDYILKIARRFKITQKDSYSSTWYNALYKHKEEKLVIIDFLDNKRLAGRIEQYSDNSEYPYIYLIDPAWVIDNEKTEKCEYRPIKDTNGILITPEQKIAFIEFRN